MTPVEPPTDAPTVAQELTAMPDDALCRHLDGRSWTTLTSC